MNKNIKNSETISITAQDDRAEAQEAWMRPGETPFDAYQRHKRELLEAGIGVPRYC